MLLPKKVGSFTLMRKLDSDGLSESFVAILDDPAGKQVVARRILPVVARDTGRIAHLRARVGDLRSARHASLVQLIDLVEGDGDLYVLEDWSDGIELAAVIHHCITNRTTVPHNVYLNLATQVCNALEALHGRPGTESGSENVLHLAMAPAAIWVASDGRVSVGHYGLARSPTAIATAATGALPAGVEYLAPEQTHQDQKLTPASDIFSLGAILYELLTLKPMFRADSSLQTIHRVRRAEVTTQLLEVKEIMPGLDKVLFRALSLNPRHRYQRAFVLREDLRGLMAGYSFNDIDTVTRAFLAPIVRARAEQGAGDELVPAFGSNEQGGDTTGFLLGHAGDVFSGLAARADAGRVDSDRVDSGRVDSDSDATDALLRDPDSDVEGNTDQSPAYDPEDVDTAQNVHHELSAAFNTTDDALRAPLVERQPLIPERPDPSRRIDPPTAGQGERTKWVSTTERASEPTPTRREITSVDTGWSRIPTGELDRLSVPTSPEPLEHTSWKPQESFLRQTDGRQTDADTGSHENTTNLLEPTTGPLPPESAFEPDSITDTIDLGDPTNAPRVYDDTRPAPAAAAPPEVNADAIDTAPVKGGSDRATELARLRGTPLRSSTADTDRVPERQSSATPWTDRQDAPHRDTPHRDAPHRDAPRPVITPPTLTPATLPPAGPTAQPHASQSRSEFLQPTAPLRDFQNRTPAREPPPSREATRTLELEEPWADVPTSPSVVEADTFRSDTYESIPSTDPPVSGLTGSHPRTGPLADTRSDAAPRQRAQPPPRQREYPVVEDEPQPTRSYLPVAAVVFAGAVFLAVCAGIGGGGVLSWIAASDGGLLASDESLTPTGEPLAAVAEPVVPATDPAITAAALEGPALEATALETARLETARLEQERAEQARLEEERLEQERLATKAREEEAAREQTRLVEARIATQPKPVPVAAAPVPVVPKPVVPKPVAPKPTPVAAVVKPAPAARIEAPASLPPDETWDAVAAVELDAVPSEFAIPTTELDRWSESAFEGELSASARTRLTEVPKTDPAFTRARTLLYLDAKAKGEDQSRDEHLAAMMALPENRYNPILLVETAQIAIDKKDWQQALKAAQTAEQHWARIPSNLVFSRKAMIYEIQALAHTGMFYGSDSEDRDRLALAIRGWERYRSHVETKARTDLVARADEHLAQLNEIQRRLE